MSCRAVHRDGYCEHEVTVPLHRNESRVAHARSTLPNIKYNEEWDKRVIVRSDLKRTWESFNIQSERERRRRLPCASSLQTRQILRVPVELKRVFNQPRAVYWSVSKVIVSAWWHTARAVIRQFAWSITVLVFLTHCQCTCWI